MKRSGLIMIGTMFLLAFMVSASMAIEVKAYDRKIEISWQRPGYNLNKLTGELDTTRPAHDIYHYNVFRRSIKTGPWIKINRQIIPNYRNYYPHIQYHH